MGFGLTEIDRGEVLTPDIDRGKVLTPKIDCKLDQVKVLGNQLRLRVKI